MMIYAKPEINVLGNAAHVIQNGIKSCVGETEGIDPCWMILPAYDLDE